MIDYVFIIQEWSFSQVWVHDPEQTEQRQHAGGDSPQHGVQSAEPIRPVQEEHRWALISDNSISHAMGTLWHAIWL